MLKLSKDLKTAPLALVTGSSSGIGQAVAKRLARDGYFVLVHFNKNETGAAATLQSIETDGGQGQLIRFDSQNKEEMESAFGQILSAHPERKLEVLVNNAGIAKDMLLALMSDDAFDSVMKTNVYGPFFLMRYCIRRMMRQRSGSIVNMSSISGQTGNAGQLNYAASKAALIAMTKSLAMEVGSRGVRVNAVAPGLIETEMIQEIPMLEELKKRIPLGRLGKPEDVAGAVSFLCSLDAAYVTGITLSVNGGLYPA
jgi:3-oxoacyl-[acyl-carrier protein] reductase